MSIGNFDGLDDLVSLDSELSSPRSRPKNDSNVSSSPRSPLRVPYYNPVGLTIGQTSPRSERQLSDYSVSATNQSHTLNGVHMHIQENAKVSTFNYPVDRSNSSRPNYVPSSNILEDAAAAGPSDYSLAELFLNKESSHRKSLNQNYESMNSLLNDVGFGLGRRPSGDDSMKADAEKIEVDETQMEIDALTAAIDPTPWSEIKRKMGTVEEIAKPTPAVTAPHTFTSYNYYPYGRSEPLPIPRKPSPPRQAQAPAPTQSSAPNASGNSTNDPISQALATAAAIASAGQYGPSANVTSTAGTTASSSASAFSSTRPPTSSPSQFPISSRPSITSNLPTQAPYTKAQQTTATIPSSSSSSSTTNASSNQRSFQRASHSSAPQHALAHTTRRGAVTAATSQKSQYGFGENHMIPSVPAPPPMPRNSNSVESNSRLSNSGLPSVPDLDHGHSPPNTGAAYERKKQRAKDARVKLNESIERLAIAISLAGSQSKQRGAMIAGQLGPSPHPDRPRTLRAIEDCIRESESAKKWDRPSFVGTAAALIQGLNTQCECLLREVATLQEQCKNGGGNNSDNESAAAGENSRTDRSSEDLHHGQKRHSPIVENSESVNGDVAHATKRIRAMQMEDDSNCTSNGNSCIHHIDVDSDLIKIFSGVARLLDPVSLSRCPCVSRSWRDMRVFEKDEIWLDLAVKRFGFYNVRQWAERLEDGIADNANSAVPKKKLYRAMCKSNVMPHIQQEGVILLGESKIPGRVSGWVFMVERSNGETLRSVRRDPSSTTLRSNGMYQSLPVVELRIVIQNIGMSLAPVVLKDQSISVDTSTRRSGGELKEIYWDERFGKVIKNVDGTPWRREPASSGYDSRGELCRLHLFETVILEVYIHARGCSTMSKFQQRSNFAKVLVCLDGTTVPMVIPFLPDAPHSIH